ncbi:MAG TPA: lipopolysaccharide heptosyltransferase II [Gammaproteobacteria bacterium]|nr:lipopolysaccharide heptosyltransferase II [Gammaproteobacteria bacterium]
MRASPPKYLIVGPSWVGDMVMADSLYRLLLAREPGAEIDVVAPSWSLPILERMDEVRHAIELPVAHGETAIARRHRVGRALRGRGYTHAIVLPRSWKSALVPFFARVPTRTGYRGEWRYGLINDMRSPAAAKRSRTVERFAALGLQRGEQALPPLDPPRLRVEARAQAALLGRVGLGASAEIVALLPGAEYGPAKQWPAEYYADLAARLARVGVDVCVLGSAKERELGESIRKAAAAARVHNLCGETTLAEVVDLLGAVRIAVSNDSGLMHVAAATGAHVVALYGSSSPRMTPPLTSRQNVFYLGLECSPCFERTCPLVHMRCLRDMAVDDVCSTVITLLGEPRSSREAWTRA